MAKRLNKKSIFNIIFLILIVGGIYLIFRTGDMEKLRQVSHNLNYWGLAGVLAITAINIILIVFRWYLLLKPVKSDISFGNVFYISISAVAIDFTGPGKLGTPTKALLLKKLENIEVSRGIPSLMSEIILEYSIAGVLMVSAALIGGYVAIVFDSFKNYLTPLNITIVSLAIITGIIVLVAFRKRILAIPFFAKLVTALASTQRRKDILAAAMGITLANYFLTFAADFWLYKSIGFNVPYIFIIFSGCFAHFMALLSPLPGGIGMREMSSAYLFKIFYNLGEISVIAVLIRRILTYVALFVLFITEKFIKRADQLDKAELQKISTAAEAH